MTDRKYCPYCRAGIRQYGAAETPAGASCKFHARTMRDESS